MSQDNVNVDLANFTDSRVAPLSLILVFAAVSVFCGLIFDFGTMAGVQRDVWQGREQRSCGKTLLDDRQYHWANASIIPSVVWTPQELL